MSNITKVLLVTYPRGGSTFLGEVFNRNDQAIYWFEPLHAVKYHENKGRDDVIYVRDKTGTWRHHSEEHVTKQLKTLVDIFNCRMEQLDKQVLTDKFIKTWSKSSKLLPFRKCLRTQNKTINDCMPVAQKACDQSNIRAIKVIRVGLYMIPELLAMDPDIKVVFYIRDPRGVLLSSVEGWKEKLSTKHFGNILYPLCKRFEEDFQWIEKLRSHLIPLKYEDLAAEPFKSLDYIYSNLGFCESPGQVNRWFKHNTNATKDNDLLGTKRKNSTATAYRWMTAMDKDHIDRATKMCHQVLQDYRYSQMGLSEDVKQYSFEQ